jgi:hypothetical protein
VVNPAREMASDDEDDYMNMIIEEPQQKETFTQKKRRLQREVHYTPLTFTQSIIH